MAKLERDLHAFSVLTGIPAVCMDASGRTSVPVGCACCSRLEKAGDPVCRNLHCRAGQFARGLGETYLFSCHAGMFHAITPAEEGGFVLAGPFALEEVEPWQIPEVIGNTVFSAADLCTLREALSHIRVLQTAEASELCTLLFDLFSGQEDTEHDDAHRRAVQQQRIAEAVHAHKRAGQAGSRYPIEKEDALIRYVLEGDSRRADAVLNDLLGYAFFASGTIEDVRACTAELCSLLSRAAIEGGAESLETVQENRELLQALWRAESIDDVCYIMQEAVERFCENVFARRRTGEQECVQRAIRYIHMHFAEDLSLSRMAKEAHLSESYFSTLFKKGCGYGFREYLTKVRVDRAKELLEKSTMGVTEIAEATGFDTQSYFSKVFHAHTGMSPSVYRVQCKKG